MGKWICNRCGNEITANITLSASLLFDLDKNKNPKNFLEEHLYPSIEEWVKDNLEGAKIIYECPTCLAFSTDLEDIATLEK